MILLALDTATAATAVALDRGGGAVFEARHDPAPGERPGHATRLLGLVEQALAAGDVELPEVGRLAVGTGPGSYTGLRIGVATARALAQSHRAQLVGVSTLRTLAEGAAESAGRATRLAVLDARRGEAFAAAWRDGEQLLAPAVLSPRALLREARALPEPVLALGEGTLRFRQDIEPAEAAIPPDDDPIHRVSAAPMCRLARSAEPGPREAVLPEYLRLPDAEAARRRP
jgi:tRNA threonylcarbamoyladenosine biosynthesis protein TsaB